MTLDSSSNGRGRSGRQTTIESATRSAPAQSIDTRNAKLVKLRLDALQDNPVQPPNRTTGSDMKDLIADVRENGIVNPPYVAQIGDEYVKIDGHRRAEAWKALGHTDIQCRVIKANSMTEAEAAFARINRVVKRITGRHWFYGWAAASNREAFLRALTKGQATRIRNFVKLFGVEESEAYARKSLDPCMLNYVYVANRFITQYVDAPSLKQIGRWIIAHNAVTVIRNLAAGGKKREAVKLVECIKRDRPFVTRTVSA